jgi:predicted nucleic acid-binding Zn ribbon protein
MPVYDFKCECGKTSVITISIPPGDFQMTCVCGKTMARVYSAPAVTFKGKGWGKDAN